MNKVKMNKAIVNTKAFVDFQEAQELIYNKEVLTAEEAEICFTIIPAMAKEYLFHNSWNNTYLNLNVYSEVEKEKHDLRKEMGY